jgi:hypothetical protein
MAMPPVDNPLVLVDVYRMDEPSDAGYVGLEPLIFFIRHSRENTRYWTILKGNASPSL